MVVSRAPGKRRSCRSGAAKAPRARASWARRSACSAAQVSERPRRSQDARLARRTSAGSTPDAAPCAARLPGPSEAPGRHRSRRSDDPGRDVHRPGGRAGPGRAHARSAAGCTTRSNSPFPGVIRQRLGVTPACLHSNDGLLFRLPKMDEPPLDLLRGADTRDGRAVDPRGASRDGALRPAVSPERRPGAAHAPPRSGQADAALAPAAAGQGPAADRPADSRLSRSCWRPCASAWTTTSTCRDCGPCWTRSTAGDVRVQTRRGEIPSPFTSELIFQFTAAHLYEWDEPKRSDRRAGGLDRRAT